MAVGLMSNCNASRAEHGVIRRSHLVLTQSSNEEGVDALCDSSNHVSG